MGDRDQAAEERADDRVTASGISPKPPSPAPTPVKTRRRSTGRYRPPRVRRPSRDHIDVGRRGLAAARAALEAADTTPPEQETQ